MLAQEMFTAGMKGFDGGMHDGALARLAQALVCSGIVC
jgi:hypothetical protein